MDTRSTGHSETPLEDSRARATVHGSVGTSYGFSISGLSVPDWLGPPVPDAPSLAVQRDRWTARGVDDIAGSRHTLALGPRRRLVSDRGSASIIIQAERMVPDTHVVHPLLACGAAMHAHWAGNLALHGGVVGIRGKAWVLLAEGMGGKTSLLAAMAARGFPVLADDLAVVTPARMVHAGPRCLDLRRSAAAGLTLEAPSIRVRRHRVRVTLPPAPVLLPLGGFVALRWGQRAAIETLYPRERAALLVDSRSALGPSSAPTVLELLSARCFALVRPRSFDYLGSTIDQLVDAVRD